MKKAPPQTSPGKQSDPRYRTAYRYVVLRTQSRFRERERRASIARPVKGRRRALLFCSSSTLHSGIHISFPYRLTRIIVFSGRAREAPLNRPKLTFLKWATPIEPDRREASWQGKTLAAPIYGGQRSSPEPAAAVGCRPCPLIHPHSASALWGAALRIRSNEES